MALQTSGPISLGQIAAEYSDTAPNSMSEFRGRNGFPASPASISFNQAYGNIGKFSTAFVTATRFYNDKVSYYAYGYVNSYQGSVSPKTFPWNGRTITLESFVMVYSSEMHMSGFASDPGATGVWKTLKHGSTTLPVSDFPYSYDSSTGWCRWQFPLAAIEWPDNSSTLTFTF